MPTNIRERPDGLLKILNIFVAVSTLCNTNQLSEPCCPNDPITGLEFFSRNIAQKGYGTAHNPLMEVIQQPNTQLYGTLFNEYVRVDTLLRGEQTDDPRGLRLDLREGALLAQLDEAGGDLRRTQLGSEGDVGDQELSDEPQALC